MKPLVIAAIDIGSNSLKLAVAEADDASLRVIWQERERVRLGQETLKTRRLSAEAVKLSAAAIERFRVIAGKYEADAIIAERALPSKFFPQRKKRGSSELPPRASLAITIRF
jgi:exopolyphosphatase/pppGpp-phosphohydrolase